MLDSINCITNRFQAIFRSSQKSRTRINCLCFASKEPIAKGEKIYIFTQDFPIEGANHRIYEGCFAQVEECKKNNNFKKKPYYLIRGKSLSGKTMSINSKELGVEVL